MNPTASEILGKYEIIGWLSTSGIASLLHARDTETGSVVVLKILHAYFAKEYEALRIFLEEMEQVSHLRHPNIVQVHGVEHVGEDTAIVTDYVSFPTLKARKSQTMPVGEVIHILKQAASALDFAQGKKILHRDIRPSNVFYDGQSGQAMLSDFGIVRLVESTHALVRTTINTPLPGYSAPEQNQGLHYNPYSDVYSLAVLAYELLTGSPPFDALTPHSVLSRQLRYVPEAPSLLVAGMPSAADDVILKALEPKPENRFTTSTEFVESLVQAVGPELAQRPPVQSEAEAGEEAVTRPESRLEQTTVVAPDVDMETAERIFCPHCGTGNSASSRRCSNCWGSLAAQPVVSVEEEEKLLERYWGQLRKRKRITWIATIAAVAAFAGWWAFNLIEARPPLPGPASSITAVSGSDEWVTAQRGNFHTGHVPGPAFNPSGDVAWQFEAEGQILGSPAVADGLAFVGTNDRRIVALDAESGSVVWEYPLDIQPNSTPTVAGDLLYWGLRDGRLLALDYKTGDEVWVYKTGAAIYGAPTVVEGVLYVGSSDGGIYVLDALTGEERWKNITENWVVASPSVDQGILVFGGQDRELYMFDANNGTLRHQVDLGSGVDNSTTIVDGIAYVATRSGTVVAFDYTQKSAAFQKAVWNWWFQLWIWNVAPIPDPIPGLQWARRLRETVVGDMASDGTRLFVNTTDGVLRAFDLETGTTQWETEGLGTLYSSPIVTGDTVVQISTDGRVYGLNVSNGEEKWRISVDGSVISSPVLAGNKLFVPTIEGRLIAVQ